MSDDAQHNQTEKLARMAGQIAAFFAAYPEARAVEGIAEHINRFWSGQMRGQFLAAFKPGDPALHPLVAKAMPKIRARRSGRDGAE